MNYYFDTSALVKRYVRESGSIWVRSIIANQGNAVFTAEITLAEVAAVLAAHSRAPGGITVKHKERVLAQFLADCQEIFTLLSIERRLIDSAVQLAQRYRLRGYDAVQLATAVSAFEILKDAGVDLVFVTNDQDLLQAAQAEGLAIDDPLQHP
jgi:uncharacterized protein